MGLVSYVHCMWLGLIIFIFKPSYCSQLDSIGRKKKQEKGKVEMQRNEMVKCYGGKI